MTDKSIIRKFEDWLLDAFVPRFLLASQLVGAIIIHYWLADGLVRVMYPIFPDLDLAAILCSMLILSFLGYHYLQKSRLEKRIYELAEDEHGNIKRIIKNDGHLIDRPILDAITSRITRKLHEEDFHNFGETKVWKEVERIVWELQRKTPRAFVIEIGGRDTESPDDKARNAGSEK